MEKDLYYGGVIVYRDLFKKIIKLDDQRNVRSGYIKYIVTKDNNVELTYCCKENESFYEKYLQLKSE